MEYRRTKIFGGTYFFTVVTYGRNKIFADRENITTLRDGFQHVMKNHPFSINAIVVLHDHLHTILTLPEGDHDFSTRWRLIKTYFSRKYRYDPTLSTPASRAKKKEIAVWQRRFWEHAIRNDEDYKRHVEYIHYNPVKHGLVTAPKKWIHSSFHKYVREGKYDTDWCKGPDFDFEGMAIE